MNPLRKASLFLTAIAICCCFAAPVEAGRGIFKRFQNKQAGSADGCPGGVCPTDSNVQVSTEPTPPPRSTTRGHWSYPGTIDSHLEGTHGVATAGMTREQKLDYHDALHEGRAPTKSSYSYYGPSVTKSSKTSYGSSGGSSGSFRVGGRDKDGYIITSIGVARTVTTTSDCGCDTVVAPAPVVVTTVTPTLAPTVASAVSTPVAVKAKNQFREELVKAIQSARKAGKITVVEAAKLRTATLSPAFVERAHDLAVTQIAFSGEVNENVPVNAEGAVQVEGINWEGLTKFMEALVPLLIMLLKAFGAMS